MQKHRGPTQEFDDFSAIGTEASLTRESLDGGDLLVDPLNY